MPIRKPIIGDYTDRNGKKYTRFRDFLYHGTITNIISANGDVGKNIAFELIKAHRKSLTTSEIKTLQRRIENY